MPSVPELPHDPFAPGGGSGEGIPRPLPGELLRERLLARLLSAEEPLVVLAAGSGFGKTTLLAQYARAVRERGGGERRVAWCGLRPDDAMPTTLTRSVLSALAPALREEDVREVRESLAGSGTPLALALRLAGHLNAAPFGLSLVLDGAERLGPDAQAWLTTFLDALGEGHRVLLATYDTPNVELAHRRARGQALVLGPQDLAFSEEEARAYLAGVVARLDAIGADGLLRPDAHTFMGLYGEAMRRGWWPDRLGPLLDARPSVTMPVLHLRTLGPLEVSVGERSVRLPFARCGELLAWLALHGPSARERIVDALWDGSGSPSHAEYFKVVVRRTRAALAEQGGLDFNPLPFEGGVYGLSPRFEVRADVALLGRAAVSGEEGAMRGALPSYQGEFLSGARGEWVELVRRRALDDAVTVALMLGAKLEGSSPREALHAYRRATELDELNEDAHLGVIRVLAALGDEGSANVARRAHRRLEDELGDEGFTGGHFRQES